MADQQEVIIAYGLTNYHSYKKAAKKLRDSGYKVTGMEGAHYDFNVHVAGKHIYNNHAKKSEVDHEEVVTTVKSLYPPADESAYCTIS